MILTHDFIRKTCEDNIEHLLTLLDQFGSYIDSKTEALEELQSAEEIEDAEDVPCLIYGGTFYLYVLSEEQIKEFDFANEDSDNEISIAINQNEFIVLVYV